MPWGPRAWYPARQCCEARRVYDKTPGLFKTYWDGDGIVALSSKTYYCRDSQGQDKLSSKGLQKKANADSLTYEPYRHVLSTGLSAVVSTGASGSDPVGKCIPIGRRGLPCLTCTLKGVWRTTHRAAAPASHTRPACLPACLLAYLPAIWPPTTPPMLAHMRGTTCDCSGPFACSLPAVPGVASPRWPLD